MLNILGFLAGFMAAPAAQPLILLAEPAGEGVHLKVVGASAHAMAAEFQLEVTSQTSGGGSSTVQSGSVRLQPRNAVTLAHVTLARVTGGSWTAKLRVKPTLGSPYEIVRRSGDFSNR